MMFIVGIIVVIGSVLGGYVLHHGKLIVLYQPTEYLIIIGAGVGSFFIANPPKVITGSAKAVKFLFKGSPFKKKDYIDLLVMMFALMKLMRSKGMLAIEAHLENPESSALFSKYPKFLKNHHAEHFLIDNLRLMTMGVDDPHEMDDMITAELDIHHKEGHVISHAVTTFGDSFPAIGIVAAVLGVIITMGSIDQPPTILGGLIAAALVGTFLGIFIAYGFVGPMGQFMDKYYNEESVYFEVMKICLLSHLRGNAPAISVEFARKVVGSKERPGFAELEAALENAPTVE